MLLTAVIVTVGVATYVLNVRKSAKEDVLAYLRLLTSKDAMAARATVAEAAGREKPDAFATVLRMKKYRHEKVWNTEQYAQNLQAIARYREATFELMWIVALAPTAVPDRDLLTRLIVRRAVRAESAQVYWHLGLVMKELGGTLERWGGAFEWRDSGDRVDEALDHLPARLPDFTGRFIERPVTRLRDLGSEPESEVGQQK